MRFAKKGGENTLLLHKQHFDDYNGVQQAKFPRAKSEQPAKFPRAKSEQQAETPRAKSEQQAKSPRAKSEQPAKTPRAKSEQPAKTPRAKSEQPAKFPRAKSEQQAETPRAKNVQQAKTPKHQIINFSLSQQPKNLPLKESTIKFLFEIPITKREVIIPKTKREVINYKSLSFLSYRIYNGYETDNDENIISAVNPPNYITYDMLLSEIGAFLDNKNIYSKINKDNDKDNDKKEKLRKEWWEIWYNIIKGYDSFSEVTKKHYNIRGGGFGSKIGNKIKNLFSKFTSKKHIDTRVDPRNAQSIQPVISLPELELITALSKSPSQLKSASLSKSASHSKSVSESSSSHQSSRERNEKTDITDIDIINELLLNIETEYLNNANSEDKEYEEKYFKSAKSDDNKIHKIIFESLKKNLNLDKKIKNKEVSVNKIVCNFNPSKIIPYPNRYGFNTLFQLIKENDIFRDLHIYGMQLPHQFDRKRLLYTFIYLFHLKIYNIVDLQDCAGGTNKQHPKMVKGIGCNPYDRNCEQLMYEEAKKLINEQPEEKCVNMKYANDLSVELKNSLVLTDDELGYLNNGSYNRIPIQDMTAGCMASWELISKIKDTSKKENSVSIHCLAGAGRTGSVLLYLMIRDFCKIFKDNNNNRKHKNDLKQRLALENFGHVDIIKLIESLTIYFSMNGYNSNTENVIFEVFKLSCTILDRNTIELLEQKGVNKKTIDSIIKKGLDDDTKNLLLSKTVDQSTIDAIKKLEFKSQAIASLLRQRLNRIFFFLAKEFNVKNFYTYMRPTEQVLNLPYDEFSNPKMQTITDWKNYDTNIVYNWVN